VNVWLVMLAGGLVTYATRASFILLLGRFEMPGWFRRALRFVPAAVLSAIVAPELALRGGALAAPWANPQLLSGALAVAVAWKTRNVVLTILAGMGALLLFQLLLGRA
jgi:branched-subunit amino acid transport protein